MAVPGNWGFLGTKGEVLESRAAWREGEPVWPRRLPRLSAPKPMPKRFKNWRRVAQKSAAEGRCWRMSMAAWWGVNGACLR